MMSKTKARKTLSLFLSVVLLLRVVTAFPEDENAAIIPPKDIPEAIDDDIIADSNHVERLYALEDELNTVIFANDDDTNTIYIFDEDVKYIDQDGNIQDKSSELYEDFDIAGFEEFAFVNLDNDIRTFFPEELSEDSGIVLDTEDYTIELAPISLNSDESASVMRHPEDENAVIYEDVFGEQTAVQYTTLFDGFKEDIVLYERDGTIGNTFPFVLKTNGLIAEIVDTQINLTDPELGEVVGVISPIFVYDSNCNFTHENEMKLTLLDDGNYEIIVIVDEDFLSNPDTVYPVYIDPTATINPSGSGSSKTIQDLMITNGTNNAVNSTFMTVGSLYRVIMRFPGVMSHLQSIPTNQITNATLYLQTNSSSPVTSTTITPYYFTGPSNWIESAINNNLTATSFTAIGSAISFGRGVASALVDFDITDAVIAWKSNEVSANQGLMLRNSSMADSHSKIFNSTEATNGKPYVSVEYTPLPIWHSDSSSVGFWNSSRINIYTETVGNVSSNFNFHARVWEARAQWGSVLNLGIYDSTKTNAHIKAYGGTRAALELVYGKPIQEAGLASWRYLGHSNIIINNINRNVTCVTGAEIYVIERASIENTKMLTTHELGHVLGYFGHPTKIPANNQDVMWWQEHPQFTLRQNEKRHLKQIYDIFR